MRAHAAIATQDHDPICACQRFSSLAWQYLIEMMCRASSRGVHTITTIPPTQVSRRDEAGLAVVAPVVRGNRMEAGKDLDGIGKVEPAVFRRGVTLRRIEGDPHDFLMYPQKCKRQYGGTEKITPLRQRARG